MSVDFGEFHQDGYGFYLIFFQILDGDQHCLDKPSHDDPTLGTFLKPLANGEARGHPWLDAVRGLTLNS
jgi:hypothetical protein